MMSFTRGNHSSQKQAITGNRPVCTQVQRVIVSGESTSNEDHTWLLNPGTQNSPGLKEFKYMSAIKQCGFTKTEVEMDRKIKENKAKIQKKLQKLEERLKQNNLREIADTFEGERVKRERAETRSKLPELQGRGPASDAGMMVTQEKRQDIIEDEKQVVQYLQLERKKDKPPKVTPHVQKLVGEQRTESAKTLIRAKGRDEDRGENKSSVLPKCAGKDEPMDNKQKTLKRPVEKMEEPLLPSAWSAQTRPTDEIPNDFQLLSCTICNRSFESKRLESHVRVCRKVSTSQRPVYDGKRHRTKGTELEQFLKTHGGAEAPKVGCSTDRFTPLLVFFDFYLHFVFRC